MKTYVATVEYWDYGDNVGIIYAGESKDDAYKKILETEAYGEEPCFAITTYINGSPITEDGHEDKILYYHHKTKQPIGI